MIRYAIIDRSATPETCSRWAAEGVDFVQLRDKSLEAGALAALARQMLAALGGRTKLLVNGRADVAAAVGAAGVHLTAHPDELTPAQVRQVFAAAGRPAPVVSVSCHTLSQVVRARDGGADLLLFGPVFEKRIEGEVVVEGIGPDALRRACASAGESKVLALGGVTRENTAQCLHAGAFGVAGIRLFA
jgi:thiamine-phosphate pyrophosphorylase